MFIVEVTEGFEEKKIWADGESVYMDLLEGCVSGNIVICGKVH